MKKSISAILVAALMLIAFTACEQQPINMPGSASDYEVAKVTVASIDTSVKAMYEGDTNWSGVGTVNIVYKSGRTVDGVTATIVIPDVLAGTSVGYASVAANVSTDGGDPSVTSIDAYPVTVSGYAILKTGISVVDTITDSDLVVSEDDYAAWNPSTALTALKGKITSVKYTFADGTEGSALSDFTTDFDSTEKDEISKLIIKAGNYTKEYAMDITVPPTTEPKVTNWILFVGDEEDIPAVGDDVDETTSANVTVEFGDSLSVATNQIHVLGVYENTSEGAGDSEGEYILVEEISPTRYSFYTTTTESGKLPNTFNQKNAEGNTPIDSYDFTIDANAYVPDVTISSGLTGTISVDDPISEGKVSVVWNSASEYKPTVNGAMPQKGDFTIKAETKSGVDISNQVTFAVVYPSAIRLADVGTKVSFSVKISYDADDYSRVFENIQCPTEVSAT